MQASQRQRKWLLIVWIGLSVGVVAVDYATGPTVEFPYLLFLPVVLAARYNGRKWALILAVLSPLTRPFLHLAWGSSWDWPDIFSNIVIRMAMLTATAIVVDVITRQEREIHVLKGILPICSLCKKIRTPGQTWEQMESFITKHSEAQFSHTFCPECARKYSAENGLDDPGNTNRPG